MDIETTLKSLTQEEKIQLVGGKNFWQTADFPEKGVRSLWLSDGPHGLRKEDIKHAKENGGHSVKATCFPPECTLACSWSEELVFKVGEAIAKECIANDVDVILGPGVNIKRSPLCGRNFEYYSEDPLLAGKLAAAMIRGAEQQGIGTSLKHFAVNNQETLRMSISAEVDERALHETYLKPFEIAVKEGRPSTVMCSYNRVNGTYASENATLLTDVLRTQWGFDGLVMSDWGAVSDRALGLQAGLDLEMPTSGDYHAQAIAEALQNKTLSQKALDDACRNVLHLLQKCNATPKGAPYAQKEHHALAVAALEQSAVLLKNEAAILPLKQAESIAFIGAMAGDKGRYQGAGSSIINPNEKVDFCKAFEKTTGSAPYFAAGYQMGTDKPDETLENAALTLAKNADKVVCFVGLTDIYETEGYDRDTLALPRNQLQLLQKLAQSNENLIVVLTAGSPVAMPFLQNTKALLYLALGGEGFGEAAYNLLFGIVNPSGKLADTWPVALEDTPCALHYPMGPRVVTYNESIYVGYRYYDKIEKEVLFPFGYGLSYTQFAYSELVLASNALSEGDALTVTFCVKNTGAVDGDEIVQLYVAHHNSAAHQPKRELKAFARVSLKAGEEKTVTLSVPYQALSFYAVPLSRFAVETGDYTVSIGASSRVRPLVASFIVAGETLEVPFAHSAAGAYGTFSQNDFSDFHFYEIHSRPAQDNTLPERGSYTMQTTLGQMQNVRFARQIAWVARKIAVSQLHFSTNKLVNQKVCAMSVRDLPFKNVGLNAAGALSQKTVQTLLDICNGDAKIIDLFRKK